MDYQIVLIAVLATINPVVMLATRIVELKSAIAKKESEAPMPMAPTKHSHSSQGFRRFWKTLIFFNLLISWASMVGLIWLACGSYRGKPLTIIDAIFIGFLFLNIITFYLARP